MKGNSQLVRSSRGEASRSGTPRHTPVGALARSLTCLQARTPPAGGAELYGDGGTSLEELQASCLVSLDNGHLRHHAAPGPGRQRGNPARDHWGWDERVRGERAESESEGGLGEYSL